jgi:hypothetical protein
VIAINKSIAIIINFLAQLTKRSSQFQVILFGQSQLDIMSNCTIRLLLTAFCAIADGIKKNVLPFGA